MENYFAQGEYTSIFWQVELIHHCLDPTNSTLSRANHSKSNWGRRHTCSLYLKSTTLDGALLFLSKLNSQCISFHRRLHHLTTNRPHYFCSPLALGHSPSSNYCTWLPCMWNYLFIEGQWMDILRGMEITLSPNITCQLLWPFISTMGIIYFNYDLVFK